MSHYYDTFSFTPAQANHASQVVLDLIRNRRFFIYTEKGNESYDRDYGLHPEIFREAIGLNASVRSVYRNAREEAISKIALGEKDLGLKPPNLDNNRQLVICNRYSGGFEICRVYPITVFASVASKNVEDLYDDCLKSIIRDKPHDEIAPKTMRNCKDCARLIAAQIWSEFQNIQLFNPLNHRCVVLFESKLSCGGRDSKNDFAESCVADIQETPFAMGYLFWKLSQQTRIVQHNHVVFGTSRGSHVNVQHWSDHTPKIYYNQKGGYDCPVVFVTVL